MQDLLGDSEFAHDVFEQGGGSVVDSFYAVAALMLALIAAGFAISSTLRPRGEEDDGRVETLLATALSRRRWGAANLTVTVCGTVVVVVAGGLGLGLGYRLVTGDGSAVGRLLGATLPYVAPVLVLVAVTWLAYGVSRSVGERRLGRTGASASSSCSSVSCCSSRHGSPTCRRSRTWPWHPPSPSPGRPVLAELALAAAIGAAGFAALRHRDLG